jgi:hypothetical protein
VPWFLIVLAVVVLLVVAVAVRELARRPDPTAEPGYRPPGRALGTHLDYARAWDGPNGGHSSGSNAGGIAGGTARPV